MMYGICGGKRLLDAGGEVSAMLPCYPMGEAETTAPVPPKWYRTPPGFWVFIGYPSLSQRATARLSIVFRSGVLGAIGHSSRGESGHACIGESVVNCRAGAERWRPGSQRGA